MKDKPQAEQADELTILAPERVVAAGGEKITVRELGFFESLKLERSMMALIEGFIALPQTDVDDNGFNGYAALFGDHADAWLGFMAAVTGKPREWLAALPDDDGRLLSMEVWSVNAGFFTRRVISGMVARRVPGMRSDSANSLPH